MLEAGGPGGTGPPDFELGEALGALLNNIASTGSKLATRYNLAIYMQVAGKCMLIIPDCVATRWIRLLGGYV